MQDSCQDILKYFGRVKMSPVPKTKIQFNQEYKIFGFGLICYGIHHTGDQREGGELIDNVIHFDQLCSL